MDPLDEPPHLIYTLRGVGAQGQPLLPTGRERVDERVGKRVDERGGRVDERGGRVYERVYDSYERVAEGVRHGVVVGVLS